MLNNLSTHSYRGRRHNQYHHHVPQDKYGGSRSMLCASKRPVYYLELARMYAKIID
jgi:hypothetical protein